MDIKELAKPAIKAGGIMAGVFVVLGVLNLVPFVNCLSGIASCILGFVPGILACYFSEQEGKVPTIAEGAVLGAIAGPITTLSAIITVPLSLLVGPSSQQAMQQFSSTGLSVVLIVVITIPVVLIIGGIFSAAVNAGTGAIYAVIKNR